MKDIKKNTERSQAIDKIAREVDLPNVAAKLGLTVVNLGHERQKALCPFHDDHQPSLNFFEAKDSRRKMYHCFACNALGDVFDLVKHQLGVDFGQALKWLATETNTPLPFASSTTEPSGRTLGLHLAFNVYFHQTKDEKLLLEEWSRKRGFDPTFLRKADVFYASANKLSLKIRFAEREHCDAIIEAGLMYQPRRKYIPDANRWLPVEIPYRDRIFGERVIFAIRDARGRLVGFSGRAVEDNNSPKYLFSQDFPKRETLYRLHHVRKYFLKDKQKEFHLFLVEGVMDALRLESLGIAAVAILGSRLTDGQENMLADFSRELERVKKHLVLHYFLDIDEAGRRGTKASMVSMMRGIGKYPSVPLFDVVMPESPDSDSLDPDRFLSNVQPKDAIDRISEKCFSPAAFLFSCEMGESHPGNIEGRFRNATSTHRQIAMRDFESLVNHDIWKALIARDVVFEAHPPKSIETDDRIPDWQSKLREFLTTPFPATDVDAQPPSRKQLSNELALDHAMLVARASTQRRELPVDEGSWIRILAANDVMRHVLSERLKSGNSEAWEPMVAVRIPKPNGNTRLKALPCPEDLVLQQYMLNELLHTDDKCHTFANYIPAVRFYRRLEDGQKLCTTGVPIDRNHYKRTTETLSFAYQVEMDVVDGRAPPNHKGMFRPYLECWHEFLDYIRKQARKMGSQQFYVTRLDIEKFYDRLPRFAVVNALYDPLQSAFKELRNSDCLGHCAPLFRQSQVNDKSIDCDERMTEEVIDWFCNHSFYYQYLRPDTGEKERSESKTTGIPQGPDLSAYLANISLFSLDREVQSQINELNSKEKRHADNEGDANEQPVAAVYARYVDDMVLVAKKPETLVFLRRVVEQQLRRIGLQLNDKDAPYPSMDEDAFEEWLTAKRGVGLTVSGELGTTLACEPLPMLARLADAGELERDDSLAILYNRNLEAKTAAEVLEAIRILRCASQLRFGDEVSAANYLWQHVTQTTSGKVEITNVAKRIQRLWEETKSHYLIEADHSESDNYHNATILMIWLAGLERFLRRSKDYAPELSSDRRNDVKKWQITLAKWIGGGLCEELKNYFTDDIKTIQHWLDAQVLIIKRLALNTVRDLVLSTDITSRTQSPILTRLNLSLAETRKDNTALESAAQWGTTPLIMFHEAVVRLAVHDSSANGDSAEHDSRDPLDQMRDRIINLQSDHRTVNDALAQVLKLWLPDENDAKGS